MINVNNIKELSNSLKELNFGTIINYKNQEVVVRYDYDNFLLELNNPIEMLDNPYFIKFSNDNFNDSFQSSVLPKGLYDYESFEKLFYYLNDNLRYLECETNMNVNQILYRLRKDESYGYCKEVLKILNKQNKFLFNKYLKLLREYEIYFDDKFYPIEYKTNCIEWVLKLYIEYLKQNGYDYNFIRYLEYSTSNYSLYRTKDFDIDDYYLGLVIWKTSEVNEVLIDGFVKNLEDWFNGYIYELCINDNCKSIFFLNHYQEELSIDSLTHYLNN